MHNYEKKLDFSRLFHTFSNLLPSVFWILLIFGFEDVLTGLATLVCAVIHECGHLIAFIHSGQSNPRIRSVLSGMRIKSCAQLSYRQQIWIYLSGAALNIFTIPILLLPALYSNPFTKELITMNIATAVSNLLPIEGYDGYGALYTFFEMKEAGQKLYIALSFLSTSLIFLFSVFSLYLIDRKGGGYWIFAVFFISMIKCFNKSLSK